MSKFRTSTGWKPARPNPRSSIRGRIGPPIPIPDDDEFPIRARGAGIATSLGDGNEEQQMRLRTSTGTELDIAAEQSEIVGGDEVDPPESDTMPSEPLREPPPPPQAPPSPPRARNTTGSTANAVRDSVASVPSKKSSVTSPQRKKSTLKSVFGRLFGKKRKGSSTSSGERERSPGVRAGHHRSDPTALTRLPTDGGSSQKRSASLPINEYSRALRSHSIIADTEELPQDGTSQTNRDSIQGDGQSRPRRATTPSRLWAQPKIPGYQDWTGLSPRPASSQARGSKAISNVEDGTVIGIAVTSGSHPNRRSRSLGELRGTSSGTGAPRRRSDEIRYWRESYDPGILSPMSSNRPEAEDALLSDEADYQATEPEELPQPFNFGPLGEMAGMKITQAASLETRFRQLESQVHKMDRAVRRIYRGQSADALQLHDPPRRPFNKFSSSSFIRPTTGASEVSLPRHEELQEPQQHSLDARTRGSQQGTSSFDSSRPTTVDTSSSRDPSHETFPLSNLPISDAVLRTSQGTARPLSTSTTIRGLPSSSPTLPKDGSFTAEHFTYLTNLIVAEQTARQQLEVLVHNLQEQLRAIRSPASDHTAVVRINEPTIPTDDFSAFEPDSSDDEAHYGPEEVFRTPAEERGSFGDDTFGDVMGVSGKPKTAPRTMSLSQMTLGKGTQLV